MNEGHGVRPMPFVDLVQQRECIRSRLDAAIARVLDHGQFIILADPTRRGSWVRAGARAICRGP